MSTLGHLGLAAVLALTLAATALADRTQLKPGFNLFSSAQDVELGRKLSRDAERQLPMLNNARVDDYVNRLGHRLDAYIPQWAPAYPFQYKVVNSSEINAFALPGGFVYVNRGVIEAADNEAQLAGVMAHETSHVILRHGTNQASKAYLAQAPLSVLGGMMGSSVGSLMAQLGTGFALNSVFLRYSRNDETQADVMGAQILHDAGYDPRAMAQFFEKIQAESKNRPVEFFSDHPNPDHRIGRVDEEVDRLGGPPPNYKTDSPEFQEIKSYLRSLPPAPKASPRSGGGGGRRGVPAEPSLRFVSYENRLLRLQHPENWQAYGQGDALTLTPEGGVMDDSRGNAVLARGVIVSLFQPHTDSDRPISLEQATDELVQNLEHSNSRMSLVRHHEQMRLGGEPALSTYLSNDSPAGGRESDWLVTTMRPDGLLYIVCVAPEREYDSYDRAFRTLVDSVRFR
jgi:Zn-dependent protease with chaperone function